MNDAAWQQQFLKPPWVWQKSGQDSSLRFALNQKPVGPAKESRPQSIAEKS
jgi:hypothetical protein